MVEIKLKAKYRPLGSNVAKKCGISGDHNNKARKKNRNPHPVDRQLVKVLGSDLKIRWEEVTVAKA